MPRRMRKEMLGEAREWQDKHIRAGQKAPERLLWVVKLIDYPMLLNFLKGDLNNW